MYLEVPPNYQITLNYLKVPIIESKYLKVLRIITKDVKFLKVPQSTLN